MLEDGEHGISTLRTLLLACSVGNPTFIPSQKTNTPGILAPRRILKAVRDCTLFSSSEEPVLALRAAMDIPYHEDSEPRVKSSRETAIWRYALMRTCTVSIDADVKPLSYSMFAQGVGQTESDASRTVFIALCQRILENGGRANWLGA